MLQVQSIQNRMTLPYLFAESISAHNSVNQKLLNQESRKKLLKQAHPAQDSAQADEIDDRELAKQKDFSQSLPHLK